MANKNLSAEKRNEIGRELQELVYAGIKQKGSIEDWWRTCDENHRNEMRWDSAPDAGYAASGTSPKLSAMHVPFSQPRQDMLVAQMCEVIASQTPYMLAMDGGDDETQTKKQKAVHTFWKAAGFEKALREAASICTDTNIVQWRVAFSMDATRPFGGLIIDRIDPEDFVLFPATSSGIKGARLIAHRFYLRVKEIEHLQATKAYYAGEFVQIQGGDNPVEHDKTGRESFARTNSTVQGPSNKDLRVELFDCLVKYSEDTKAEKWYRATVAVKTGTLLGWEEYPYSRPWYFDSSIITHAEKGYWPAVSLGRHLSIMQNAWDKIHAMIYNGSFAMAFPLMISDEDQNDKDSRLAPGEIITGQGNIKPIPANTFNGQALLKQLEMLSDEGDKCARISANAQGSVQNRQITATEVNVIAQGAQTGVGEYIQNFTNCLPDMASFTCELLATHYNQWFPYWGAEIQVQESEFRRPCLWEPNGTSPADAPGAKIAAAQMLVNIAESPLGPVTGIDPHALVEVIIANTGLSGSDNIQMTKEQMQQMQMQAQNAAPPQGPNQQTPPGGSVETPEVAPPPSQGIPSPAVDPLGGNGEAA